MNHNEMRVDARKLIHIIKFQKNANQTSDRDDNQWQEIYECFSEIKPFNMTAMKMTDKLEFGHVIMEKLFIFKLRYEDIIKTNLRINFKDRLFEIKRIINFNEANKILQIIALEI